MKRFEKVLDKATSVMLLEPDFESMLQLCDMIRGGDIKERNAAALLKTKVLEEQNPNSQYFSLCVVDTVMKNCGEGIHEEILTESFLEKMKSMATASTAEKVKDKVLEMIQSWGIAFKDKSDFRIVSTMYSGMKAEGFKFAAPIDVADMFKAERAPVWKEGDECMKCKTEFGIVQRKHHCRACGGIFCNRCTSKQSIIPKFGIEKEVRVCDKCYNEISGKSSKTATQVESDSNGLPAEYLQSSLAKESQLPPQRDEASLREEEELQVALALSLDEQENKHIIKQEKSAPTQPTVVIPKQEVKSVEPEMDPELARYLNRSYWENKKDDTSVKTTNSGRESEKASIEKLASPAEEEEPTNAEPTKENQSLQQNSSNEEEEDFLHNLRTSVEIFMNRMRSNQMRNRSIANDSSVQSLFQTINQMHPKLLNLMSSLEDERLHYEELQDKLTQIRDARAALDALRQEYAEKMRRAAEEAERQRQIQMAHKLHIMRQKKQEYLAYQRQLALQRMQEQEAARQARLEQHKQFIMQRAMQPPMVVPNYNYAPQPQQQMGQVQALPQTQHDYQHVQPPSQIYQEFNTQQPQHILPYQVQQIAQGPASQGYGVMDNAHNGNVPQGEFTVATAPPPTPQATHQVAPHSKEPSLVYASNQQPTHPQHGMMQTVENTQIPQQAANLISFD